MAKANREQNFTLDLTGKQPKFICSCGSEMWDNRTKKKSPKHSDLRCKNNDCPAGSNGYPNSVYLSSFPEVQKQLNDFESRPKQSNAPQVDVQQSVKSPFVDKYAGNIPSSMYFAWAKDIAIYLAQATNVQAHDDFDALLRTCLQNMRETVVWFQTGEVKKQIPVAEQVKDVTPAKTSTISTAEDDPFQGLDEINIDDLGL